jgi:sulfate adenylyltransferase
VLLTYQGAALAAVTIDAKWVPNKALECLKAYGTSSLEHPAVQMVAMERGRYYMGEPAGVIVCVEEHDYLHRFGQAVMPNT